LPLAFKIAAVFEMTIEKILEPEEPTADSIT
jgi:DNA-binding XRE family transcriptional regulator